MTDMNVEMVLDYGPLSTIHYLNEGYAVGTTTGRPGSGGSTWLTVHSSHYQGSAVIFPTREDADVRAEWLRDRVVRPDEIQVRRVDRDYRILN